MKAGPAKQSAVAQPVGLLLLLSWYGGRVNGLLRESEGQSFGFDRAHEGQI